MSAVDRVQNITCSRVIPKYYEGIREMEAVAEGSDHILSLIRKTVTDIDLDRYIQTATEPLISVWEDGLGITPQGSLDERRTAVLDALNRDNRITQRSIVKIIQKIMGDIPFSVDVDPVNLRFTLRTENIDFDLPEGTDPPTETARKQIKPLIPQNLETEVSYQYDSETSLFYGVGVYTLQKVKLKLGEQI